MTDPDAVADALARLATGERPPTGFDRGPPAETTDARDPAHTSVVAEAAEAFTRVSTAAAFLEDGGERRLTRAIDDANRSGNHAVAERGVELVTALDRFRAAADGRADPTDE